MRSLVPALLALAALGPAVRAQEAKAQLPKDTPPPAVEPLNDKNQKYLDAYLKAWENRMSQVECLETKIVLTEVAANPQNDGGPKQTKTVYTGEASLMKPNYAKMLLKEDANPTNSKKWRHFVADGSTDEKGRGPFLWEYDYGRKVARVLQLPKAGVGDNTLMSFLFGMKADEIKKRYHLSIDVENNDKHNKFYLHIGILPKSREDMQEFKKAELVLWKNNEDPKYADVWMLPARLWFQHPNGDQVTWEFKNLTTQKKFHKSDFKAPGFPDRDWKSEWVKPPTPTVTRTSGTGK